MTKDALLQIRIDSATKEEAEKLYTSMGLSLSDAVRIFIRQSLIGKRLPLYMVSRYDKGAGRAKGILKHYSAPSRRGSERDAWIESLRKTNGNRN